MTTTLGGRFFIYDAYPYSFKEYLAAQQVELKEHWEYDTIQISEVKQPLSYNRLKNVIVATGSPISVPTTIDYAGYAADSWLILPMENEVGKLTEKETQK